RTSRISWDPTAPEDRRRIAMQDARDQRADDKGELVLTEQERALLAETAAMTERLRGELEEIREEVAELQEGRSTGAAAPSVRRLPA
ncbi:hypothetical protein, partial [Streptomyces sp. 5-10]|uniref:hypothetical protein n=1 Tax=Streptomyces sp. 5-10 TaxID=878925 RepID=UPI001CC31639